MAGNTAPLPIELTRRIGRTLFPGREEGPIPMPRSFRGKIIWVADLAVNWFILLLAIVNFAVVIFDFSYLDLRHLYQRFQPELVTLYDPVKGVEPHRTTETYLERAELTLQRLKSGPGAPGVPALLSEMQDRSQTMFHEDPFSGAGLAGVFEQIKNKMRREMHQESAKQAFTAFWSAQNLSPTRLAAQTEFFEAQIRPLMARNYYRGLGENGKPYDAFWMIDFLFVPFFALEFLLRGTLEVGRRYPSWKAFCYARWYDLVYFVPVGQYVTPLGQSGWLHLVRAVSVGHRMRRLGLINPISIPQRYANRVIELFTDLVSVRLLNNYQDSVRKFDLAESIRGLPEDQKRALGSLAEEHLTMLVTRVIPRMTPEIEELITYSAQQALRESPSYQRLRAIPLFGSLPERYLPELVSEMVSGTQRAMMNALDDPEHRASIQRASEKLLSLLLTEMAELKTEDEVKRVVVDILEQQKSKLLS